MSLKKEATKEIGPPRGLAVAEAFFLHCQLDKEW